MSRFQLTAEPIDIAALKAGLRADRAGGYTAFEGWVRDHNEGLAVTRLEYEAFPALALKEGERIIAEAMERFGVSAAQCVHRVGSLSIGDVAVWVGVAAEHRGEAFAACRYIIDQIKVRVPIWKKEHYADGDSGWVNCERCAEHGHAHHSDEAGLAPDLYARQLSLKEVGVQGQRRLAAARVLVVGAGGLGSPALLYLAGAGVGHLGICEGDRLEASNLHRQILYGRDQIGGAKATLAAERVAALNPDVEVEVFPVPLDADNIESLFNQHDLVLDCSDNLRLKFLMNAAAVRTGKPVIFASVYQYEGQLHVFDPRAGMPCLRCLWPDEPEGAPTCTESGVLGPVPGVFGSLQAMEAIKQLLTLPGRLAGELVMLDLLSFRSTKLRAGRRADCEVCSLEPGSVVLPRPALVKPDYELDYDGLPEDERAAYRIIDIRELHELEAQPITRVVCQHLAMSSFPIDAPPLATTERYLLCCRSGRRSLELTAELRRRGWEQVYSLRGGVLRLEQAAAPVPRR